MQTPSITGAHAILYSRNAEADRAFLRDELGLPHVDVGHGWLIFGLPPSEVAVHPSDGGGTQELYFLCDDVEAFIARMTTRQIACSAPAHRGWGRLTTLTLPGGGTIGVYEPRHARPSQAAAGGISAGPPGAGGSLELARAYLAALEAGATGEALARFYAPDVIQEELPNRLMPAGARRDLAALLDGALRGQKVMQRQRFELVAAHEAGHTVALEVQWTGTLAVPMGSLPVGGAMRAHFAVFLELRDGRIVRQRNYDCFEPW